MKPQLATTVSQCIFAKNALQKNRPMWQVHEKPCMCTGMLLTIDDKLHLKEYVESTTEQIYKRFASTKYL